MKSMLLVDILARELKAWPEGVRTICQGPQGWLRDEANYPLEKQLELSFDWQTAKVTHAEWQSAVEALKAEQESEPVIDWRKQPKDFPLWLEGTTEENRKHSGWYRKNGEVFTGEDGGQWRASREGQFFTVHRKTVNPPVKAEQAAIPALGEYWPGQGGHNGGLVAAHGNVAAHYLIIAAKDVGSHEWGGRGNESQATSKRDGFANTVTLMEGDHPAAKAATGYTADGHDNFYLPAAAELYHCWLNAPDLFAKDTWCWSSTQRSAYYAFSVDFDGGYQGSIDKDAELRVRPVRRLFIDSFINSGGDDSTEVSTERAVEWDGMSLPFVGLECEYHTTDAGDFWCRATVKFLGTHFIIVGYKHPNFGISEAGINHALIDFNFSELLRPIRTQEQIAAEEREKAIEEIRKDTDYILDEICASAVIAAGYRKQVTK